MNDLCRPLLVCAPVLAGLLVACSPEPRAPGLHAEVSAAVGVGVSAPVRLMPPSGSGVTHLTQALELPPAESGVPISVGGGYLGLGLGLGAYQPSYNPPDVGGAIGPRHYVQVVSSTLAVFDRTGALLSGPTDLKQLFMNVGGWCTSNNDGQPSVLYDRQANRFVVAQLAVEGTTTTTFECIAISRTADPTGDWWAFSFGYPGVIDSPRLATWPDGYYFTADLYSPLRTSYLGARVCAYERSRMLTGASPMQHCFSLSSSFRGVVVGDHDGPYPPPPGAPASVLALGDQSGNLAVWTAHIDWARPALSLLTGPMLMPVTPFTRACPSGACVTQPGTTTKLEARSDRLTSRASYKNFVTHQSLVVNHTIASGIGSGVRWYEVRAPTTSPFVYQSGTIAPLSAFRWNASPAMDLSGNVAAVYNVASQAWGINPSIRVSGRVVTDLLGSMPQGESEAYAGPGVRVGTDHRWGGSTLTVDPLDDCTFWYTNQYVPATDVLHWATRFGSFRLPHCSSAEFAVQAVPSDLIVDAGTTATSVLDITRLGMAGSVGLSADVEPAGRGLTASVDPSSGQSGFSSTLSVVADPSAKGGAYTVTVTGTGSGSSHQAMVGVLVNQADFRLAAAPATLSVPQGTSATSVITTTQLAGPGTVVLDAQVISLGTGVTASISPGSVAVGGSATLTLTASLTATPGPFVVKVTGTKNGEVYSTSVAAAVPLPPDFALLATPDLVQVIQGGTATSALSTQQLGPPGTIALSAVVSPSGAGLTASLSVATLAAGGNATLTLSALPVTPPGQYTVTVIGIEGHITHQTVLTVTLEAPADFRLSASPATLSLIPGMSTMSTVKTVQVNAAGTIALSVSVVPPGQGVTATITPSSVAAGGSAVVSVAATDLATSGRYSIVVTGVEGAATHSTPIALTLVLPADFTISAVPNTLTLNQGERQTTVIKTTREGVGATVAFAATVAPPLQGVTATIVPDQTPSGNPASLGVAASDLATPGEYVVTVRGTQGTATHDALVPVTVVELPADFTLSADPTSLTLTGDTTQTSTLTTTRVGSEGTVDFTLVVAPAGRGVTAAINPASLSAGGSAKLSVTAADAGAGNYSVTVVGTEGEFVRQVVVRAVAKVKAQPPEPDGCACTTIDFAGLAPLALVALALLGRRRALR